jgi:hypothetical protein
MLTGTENYIYCYSITVHQQHGRKNINVNAGTYLQVNTVLPAMRLRFFIELTEQVGFILSPYNGSTARF